MKEKLQFSDFVQALVEADARIKEAAGLDSAIAAMTKQKQALIEELRRASEDAAAAKAGAEKYRENLNKESASIKASLDADLETYRKRKHDEQNAITARCNQAIKEAHDAVARATSEAETARANAATARRELDAIQADLTEAQTTAAKLSKFVNAGKA